MSEDPQNRKTKALGRILVTISAVLIVVATVLSATVLTILDKLPSPGIVATHTLALNPTSTFTTLPTMPPHTITAGASPSPTPRSMPTHTTECSPPLEWVSYIVQEGETLPSLALRHGLGVYAVMQANCLSSQTIAPGQVIWVPPPDVTPTHTVMPTPCGPPAGWKRYTVEKGDTLYSLSQRHRSTVVAIKQANCLSSNLIVAGQKLWLPPLPPTPIPTLTATPTETPTTTSTPSPTGTSEISPLPTPTETPRATPTSEQPTDTPEPTPTGTAEPSPTHTPESTPTDTPEPTPTDTPEPTPTDTQEPPPTDTPESTPTETVESIPTNTPTATP